MNHYCKRSELKTILSKVKYGDRINIIDKYNEVLYSIFLRADFKTTVEDKNWKELSCTAGVRGGWPYYIADFIHEAHCMNSEFQKQFKNNLK